MSCGILIYITLLSCWNIECLKGCSVPTERFKGCHDPLRDLEQKGYTFGHFCRQGVVCPLLPRLSYPKQSLPFTKVHYHVLWHKIQFCFTHKTDTEDKRHVQLFRHRGAFMCEMVYLIILIIRLKKF